MRLSRPAQTLPVTIHPPESRVQGQMASWIQYISFLKDPVTILEVEAVVGFKSRIEFLASQIIRELHSTSKFENSEFINA